MTKPKFKSAIELFEPSARIVRDNINTFGVLLILPTVLSVFGGETAATASLAFIGALLAIAFIPPLTKLYLLSAKGKVPTFDELFKDSYKYFWRLIGLGILAGLIIITGLILLIVPGIIMMRRYVMAPFYLMDKNMKIWDAMELSAKQTKPYSWKIYEVIGVLFLIGLISTFGVVGLIIGTIASIIYSAALPLRYYETLSANKAITGDK